MKTLRSIRIILLYIVFVCIYGVIVSSFTSTVHIGVDEELYLEMARSFHYEGHFVLNGEMLNYSCILYSMLISLAYFLYSPENILLIMRLIGVVTMTSAIFPIWLLSRKLLRDDRIALRITAFSMLLPFMFDSAYIMQEVLAYPLFLWTLWFLLCAMENGQYRWYILASLFGALCFFTKTYLFFIPIVFNILEGFQHKQRRRLRELIAFDITYLTIFLALYSIPYIVNNFMEGNNHYSRQFSHLFPVGLSTIICAISCSILYLSFMIVNTGVLPFAALIWKRKNSSEYEERFWNFILLSVLFLVIEIVVMIVLTEEGNVLLPRKYLFRYFQIFTVPLLLAFITMVKEVGVQINKKQLVLLSMACIVTVLYWIVMNGRTRHGIIDGHLFLLFENMNRIVPYAGAVAVACFSLFIMIFARGEDVHYYRISSMIVIGFWALNCVQLPYFTNEIAGGVEIEKDAVKIAEYVNACDISNIYYVKMENTNRYLQNCYGYFKQPFIVIDLDEVDDFAGLPDSALIVPAKADVYEEMVSNGLKRLDLTQNTLDIYVTDSFK